MEEKNKEVYQIPLDDILPNRFQPRLTFDDKELEELSNSIKRYGVIQPIVLRKLGDKYEIIAGERRYKASTLAGLTKIPAIIMDTDDNTSAEIALLENLQRKNLTPIEEAQSYKKLMDKGFTQEDIATKLGVSQSSVANKVRLLNLPEEVQNALLYNKISERHARCLLTLDNKDYQNNLLEKIINDRLTVKQTEEEIHIIKNKKIDNDPITDLQFFLNPEPKLEEPIIEEMEEVLPETSSSIETLDFKVPEVIDIEETKQEITEKIVENEELNPFQDEHSLYDIVNKLDDSRELLNEIKKDYEVNDLSEEYNTLPHIINKVRDFTTEIKNDKVAVEEFDLEDSYQIIIRIKKD